ncbi:hypothetical protein [Chromobacterium piscinae]|uniref:hypothetical protein n=1 Tax=Chromobacterium piscinae TaxID=686831 RepID=UPI003F80D1BB
MDQHTKEPWPPFIDVCELVEAQPDSEPFVRMPLNDYYRAKICVSACAGLSDAVVSHGLVTVSRHSTVAHQRDQALAALASILAVFEYHQEPEKIAAVQQARAAIAAAKVPPL